MGRRELSVVGWHAEQRSQYAAARDSRLRKRRIIPAMGNHGDSHLPGNDFYKVMEYARALDRDDTVVGSVLDRAEINTIRNGFLLDFDTGDNTLDQDLLGGWTEQMYSDSLDVAGEQTFSEMEADVFRYGLVDADQWGLLTDDDQIQLFESHLIRTPMATAIPGRTVNLGVELGEFRRQKTVFIANEDLSIYGAGLKYGQYTERPVRDETGLRRMVQFYAGPKRRTLTRGISVFQKLFDLSGMHDDTQFAALLKQQLQNAIVFTEQWKNGDDGSASEPYGEQEKVVGRDGVTTETVEGIGPAMAVRSKNGRELKPFMNSAPGPEYIQHIKMILTLMGINLGMPLILVLMDASETNFSGWRAAFDQAKLGFERNQNRMLNRWHEPILKWYLASRRRKSASIEAAMSRIVAKAKAAGTQWYKWHLPTWPYINPMEDSQANLIAVANYQEAPSTNMARRGLDHDREGIRGIRDRGFMIEQAIKEAERLNSLYPNLTTKPEWSDLYTPPAPKHVQIAISEKRDPAGGKSNA